MTSKRMPLTIMIPAFCCLAAAMFLLQEIIQPPEMPDWRALAAHGNADAPRASRIVTNLQPDKQLYEVIAARPLFSETRRPAPGANALPAASLATPPLNFSLIGVVNAPDQRLAIVNVAGSATNSVLHQGNIFNGWKIIDIQQTSISVRAGSTVKSVKLTQ